MICLVGKKKIPRLKKKLKNKKERKKKKIIDYNKN